MDKLCSVDLLHIDDVGAEQTTSWVLEQLYTVVNTRYEDRALADPDHEPDQAGPAQARATSPEDEWDARPDAELRGADRRPDGLAAVRDVRRSAADVRRRPPPGEAVQRARVPVAAASTPDPFDDSRWEDDEPALRAAAKRRRSKTAVDSFSRHGRNRDRGRPVGRRGQRQGRRPPRGEGGSRDPLPGRQQRRAHHRARRRALEVPPDPVRDPLSRQAVRDRQRRRDRPEGADRRAGRAAREGRGPLAACASAPTRT